MPYCPMCRIEYRDDATKCSDCDVELVAELPPEPEDTWSKEELVPVFTASDNAEADLVAGILESAGIRVWVRSEGMRRLLTLIPSAVDTATILVFASHAEEARTAIEQALAAGEQIQGSLGGTDVSDSDDRGLADSPDTGSADACG